MKYLYKDLPGGGKHKDLSGIKAGDSLEVRIAELGSFEIINLFEQIDKIKCDKIEMNQVDVKGAFGPVQVFYFNWHTDH